MLFYLPDFLEQFASLLPMPSGPDLRQGWTPNCGPIDALEWWHLGLRQGLPGVVPVARAPVV